MPGQLMGTDIPAGLAGYKVTADRAVPLMLERLAALRGPRR